MVVIGNTSTRNITCIPRRHTVALLAQELIIVRIVDDTVDKLAGRP
jgi:hypothetical protein